MITIYIITLLIGLLLGVSAMLYGTERKRPPKEAPHERRSEHNPEAEPSPLFNVATVGAFAFAAGLAGHLLTRYTALGIAAVAGIAAGLGALAFLLQALLIARWAIPGARNDQVDERYLLQGTIGTVTKSIPADDSGIGEIRYSLEGNSYSLPARNFESGAIAAGTDIVIERIEHGIAYVELWAQVEQRL